MNFNSRPHEEVDDQNNPFLVGRYISTHDLTKRSTRMHTKRLDTVKFQLTTSRRGRLFLRMMKNFVWHFNSRPHEEVDYHFCSKKRSKRGRQVRWGFICTNIENFNSRPHEEVDRQQAAESKISRISTHDLTKRSTSLIISDISDNFISTHDLTKRSTIASAFYSTINTFQLTTSRRGRPYLFGK